MAENQEPASLDALMARAHEIENRARTRSRQVHRARDDWNLVEVGVDGRGEVVEVAVNAALVGRAEPCDLAESILQAVRAAQRREREARHGGA